MFEDYQNQARKKPDEWFYPSIAFGVLTILVITIFTLDFSGLISISRWFSEGMKIEGEIAIQTAAEQPKANLRAVKICLVAEDKILEWIKIKKEKAVIDSKKSKLNLEYAVYNKSKAEREYYSAQTSADRAKWQSLQTNSVSELEKAEAAYRYWTSPEYYLKGLQDCAARTVSDSQGEFTLNVKPGKYALAAEAGREVTNLKENYFWLLWVAPETVLQPLTLDNSNLMTANPPETVVEIKDL